MKQKVYENEENLFYYLIFLRIFPGSPNWLMNISFAHLDIPIHKFSLSIFIGLAPWNFITCNAGKSLQNFMNKQ